MAIAFYPHPDDAHKGTLDERIEVLMESAQQYKALVLDQGVRASESDGGHEVGGRIIRCSVPRELEQAFNWEDISITLREVHELPEGSKEDKAKKSYFLLKMAEMYETLRGAKMSKLEAVRLALVSEARQLTGGNTQQVA